MREGSIIPPRRRRTKCNVDSALKEKSISFSSVQYGKPVDMLTQTVDLSGCYNLLMSFHPQAACQRKSDAAGPEESLHSLNRVNIECD